MKTYRLSSEAIKKFSRRILWTIPIVIGGLFVSMIFIAKIRLDWFLVVIPLFFGLILFSVIFYFSRKQQREFWGAYALVLKDDSLLQKQEGMADIEISRGEITSLGKGPGGILIVKTASRYKKIAIPKELDGFEELKTILEQWRPLGSATSQRFEQMLTGISTFAFIVLHNFRGWIEDQRYLIFADLAFAIAMLWTCVETQRNPYVDARTKRISWLVVLPVLFAMYDLYRRLPGD